MGVAWGSMCVCVWRVGGWYNNMLSSRLFRSLKHEGIKCMVIFQLEVSPRYLPFIVKTKDKKDKG